MRSHLVLIIQSNCCLHVTLEFHPGMEMYVLPGPKIFPIIGTLIKLHFKKIQVQIQVYKECNISVYVVIILFVYFFIKKVLIYEIKWDTFYSGNAHTFDCYCCHCITNISHCISINRNKKNLNKLHDGSTTTKSYSLLVF